MDKGTNEGAIISAANIDYTMQNYFGNSKDELSYTKTSAINFSR